MGAISVECAAPTPQAPVHYRLDAAVAWITLADTERGNPLNRSSLSALKECLTQAQAEPACRVIVLTNQGDSFCSGMDFEAVFTPDLELDVASLDLFRDCLFLLNNSLQPMVCCIKGNVTGGGLGLVAACDIVLVESAVTFMLSEVVVGMIPALITPFLKQRLSIAQIQYLTLSSKGISAQDAKGLGLIDEIVPEGDWSQLLKPQLQRLLRSSPEAIAASKQYFAKVAGQDIQQESRIAMESLLNWFQHPGIAEAIQGFGDGFSPPWFQKYRGNIHV